MPSARRESANPLGTKDEETLGEETAHTSLLRLSAWLPVMEDCYRLFLCLSLARLSGGGGHGCALVTVALSWLHTRPGCMEWDCSCWAEQDRQMGRGGEWCGSGAFPEDQ